MGKIKNWKKTAGGSWVVNDKNSWGGMSVQIQKEKVIDGSIFWHVIGIGYKRGKRKSFHKPFGTKKEAHDHAMKYMRRNPNG